MMSDRVSTNHLRRLACVYIRQSTLKQMERNRESTARQYRLLERAVSLGWPADRVHSVDEDQGLSGSGTSQRKGFESMASEVALGRVGLVLAIEQLPAVLPGMPCARTPPVCDWRVSRLTHPDAADYAAIAERGAAWQRLGSVSSAPGAQVSH